MGRSTFKRINMKSEMIKADGGKYTEYPEYEFSTTAFMKKDKIGGRPLPAKRRRR